MTEKYPDMSSKVPKVLHAIKSSVKDVDEAERVKWNELNLTDFLISTQPYVQVRI